MGIKDLWTILTPFCERKPLYELQGKIVAVDLSCWICEAQNISEYSVQPRMYLRNLYFRTCYLLLMDVIPIFVLEGKAPALKFKTIANRNEIQFKGAKPKSDKVKTGKDRTRFHFVLKQCEDMLRYMGLACVTGSGEAESMCAYLNEDELVSGCISQDSDCFAYGAKVVYRNFSISQQGSHSASGGAVDVYDIRKAYEFLNFGRNKIIALALLCGSDYNDGVHGVGKDSAMKFMNKYKDDEILERMKLWRQNESMFDELEKKIANKNVCSSCGHFGKIQSHVKVGCTECNTTKGCDFTKYREQRLEIKNELQIRNKAIVDPNFPNEELINEYLVKKDNVRQLDLKWKQPSLVNFVKFTVKFLGWEEIYAFEKLLPILTRWQVLNFEYVAGKASRNSINDIKGILYPDYIKKIRNPKGIQSYEIIWVDRYKYFEHLISEEQLEEYLTHTKNGSLDNLWSTIEPKHLVDKAYPTLVNDFMEKKNSKGKKAPKRKKQPKPNNEIDAISNQLLNTSITEPKPKKTRKKHTKTNPDLNTSLGELNLNNEGPKAPKTLDSYFKKSKVEQLKQTSNVSFDLNASNFGDEDDDFNISDIIDNIVNRSPKLPDKIQKLGYQIVKSNPDGKLANNIKNVENMRENYNFFETLETNQPITTKSDNLDKSHELNVDLNDTLNQSSFFQSNYDQIDLFEKTFDKEIEITSSSDENNDDSKSSETEDDFLSEMCLYDRIKKKMLAERQN